MDMPVRSSPYANSPGAEPDVDTEHIATNAMLLEDVFALIVPFLTMHTRRLMMCDNSTQCKIHNAWCYECVEWRDDHKCAETFEACPECKILRAVILVSRRWNQVTWNQRCLRPDSIPFSESYISFLERKPNATEEERMAFFGARDPDWKFYQPQIPGLVCVRKRLLLPKSRTMGGRFNFY